MPTTPGRLRALVEDRRFRFLVIGGLNTVFATALFIAFELWFGSLVYSFVPLGLAWIISLVSVFFLHRSLVFHVRGHVLRDLARFALVNASALAVNAGLLFLASDVLGWPRIPCQLVITAGTVAISYLGHKHFSFHRSGDRPPVTAEPKGDAG
jgi:putative flippase GtrA